MSQMDFLVTNVAELLTAAVQEVLYLMGQAVAEYQKDAARTRLENQNLQLKLKELQERTAVVSDEPLSGEHHEIEDLIYHEESPIGEQEQPGSLSDSMLYGEENPTDLKPVLDELSVDNQRHSLQGTCDNSLTEQRPSSQLSNPLRVISPSSPGISEAPATSNPEEPLSKTSSEIKVESKPEPLDCSFTEIDEVTPNPSVFSIPEAPLVHEHNQQNVSNMAQYIQTHKSPYSTSVTSKHILRSRIENTEDIHNASTIGVRREFSYSCHVCGKTFASSSSLGAHFVCHSNERPFICNCCNFRFSRLADLKKHERIHTGERPYKCSFCGRRFNRTENLKRHIKKIHYAAL